MTNLSEDTKSIIENVVELCKSLQIENVVIDRTMIRGENKENGIILIQKLPDVIGKEFEFDGLGITRVSVLKNRMSLFDKGYEFIADTKTKDNGDVQIFKLKLKSGKTAIDFKCADPLFIRAPKSFNDPVMFTFKISQEALNVMARSASAMSSETITFTSSDQTTVAVKVTDKEGDLLNHQLDTDLTLHDAATKDTFSASYKFKILLPILKYLHDQNSGLNISMTKRGALSLKCNGMHIFVIPEII